MTKVVPFLSVSADAVKTFSSGTWYNKSGSTGMMIPVCKDSVSPPRETKFKSAFLNEEESDEKHGNRHS